MTDKYISASNKEPRLTYDVVSKLLDELIENNYDEELILEILTSYVVTWTEKEKEDYLSALGFSLCCYAELEFVVCDQHKNKMKLSSAIGHKNPYQIYDCDFYNHGYCPRCLKLNAVDKGTCNTLVLGHNTYKDEGV